MDKNLSSVRGSHLDSLPIGFDSSDVDAFGDMVVQPEHYCSIRVDSFNCVGANSLWVKLAGGCSNLECPFARLVVMADAFGIGS